MKIRHYSNTWIQLAVVTGLIWSTTCGAVETPHVAAVKVRLFLQHSGELSRPLDEREELWNVVTGAGDPSEPANSALVDVVVSGSSNTLGGKHAVTVRF